MCSSHLTGGTNVCTGVNTTTLQVAGYSSTIVKWQYSTSATFASNVNDTAHTDASIVINNLTQTTYYRVVIANTACTTFSSIDTIIVDPLSEGGIAGNAPAVCTGTNTSTVSLSGQVGDVVKWQSSSASNFASSVTDIDTTDAYLPIQNLQQTTYYRAIVKNGICEPDTSTVATISVSTPSVAGTVSKDTTVCTGSNFTLSVTGNSGAIQWQSSTGGAFSNIGGATTATYNAQNLTATTQFRVVVTNGACAADTSLPVTITVSELAVGGDLSILIKCLQSLEKIFKFWGARLTSD